MKWTKLYLLSFLFLLGCNESEITSCESDNPINDLEWLSDDIEGLKTDQESLKFQIISRAVFEGNTVFLFGNCCPSCNTVTSVKNCLGEQFGIIGNQDGGIPYDALKEIETVWKSEDSACGT